MTRRIPDVVFKTRVRNNELEGPNPFEWRDLPSKDLFAGKRVVVFALPGAFTPTCSSTHLPGYESHFADFTALGVDRVVCLSVNDAFVMHRWGESLGIKNVFLLPDGNAEFTRKMGMLVDKTNLGFGMRSWRYSMLVEDGTIEKLFSEVGYSDRCQSDPFEVSDAETMLEHLRKEMRPK